MIATQMRQRVMTALNRNPEGRLTATLGSVLLSARNGARCAVTFDARRRHWIQAYRDGIVVDTRLRALSAAVQDRDTRDIFLYDYRPRPGDVIVDVGAGVGSEVRVFSRSVGPEGRVISVEAHPAVCHCLRRTVQLNRLTNVTVVECAVVGEPGPVFLDDDVDNHIGNGLSGTGVKVEGRTLQQIVDSAGVDRIALLKMNIEGAELPVLEQGRAALDRVDNLVVSCHDFKATSADDRWFRTFAPVRDLLREAGYAIRHRPEDPRPWVRYYLYASRPGRTTGVVTT